MRQSPQWAQGKPFLGNCFNFLRNPFAPFSIFEDMGALTLVVQYAIFVLLWFAFAATFTAGEVVAGLVASAATVLAVQTAFRSIPLCFQPKLTWLAEARHLPVMVGTDLGILVKYVLRRAARKKSLACFTVERFDASGNDCKASAQRALAVLFLTVGPNSIAVHVDASRRSMLVHQLEPVPMPALVHNLEK